jgi:serine protease AprX
MVNRWLVSFFIIFCFIFAPIFQPANALNEVVDIIHVRDLWTAEWTAPNGTTMHGITGKGITVAIIDSGIDGTHPDFAGRIVYNAKFTPGVGWVEIIDTDINQLVGSHGTFCAGEIGTSGENIDGKYRGVAPECNLIGLSVDQFVLTNLAYVEQANQWIYDNAEEYGIKVVSNSYGTTSGNYTIFPNAMKSVLEKNVLYIYAIGNGGGDGSKDNTGNANDPRGIITVGGCQKDAKTMWEGSSRGNRSNASTWPCITAPSCLIVSTIAKNVLIPVAAATYPPGWQEDLELCPKGYGRDYGNGTSAAAPLISGVSALIFQVNPNLTPAPAKQIIELSADPIFGPYNETGWFAGHGLVNGTRAVAVANYLALRPNSTIDEALEYYRVVRNADGKIILNPLPLPEIPKNETTNPAMETQNKFIPGFEFSIPFLAICATFLLCRKRKS